jgi:hypothetical protein
VEEGLELVRHWETQGETRFRPLLKGLFRFGVAVYRAYQPQFLTEFVLENLDPKQEAAFSNDSELHATAAQALAATARDLHHDGFAAVNTPRFDKLLETLRALQITERRLRDLTKAEEGGPAKPGDYD